MKTRNRKEYLKDYYKKNIEKFRFYYLKNKQKYAKRSKKHYLKNKKKIKEYLRIKGRARIRIKLGLPLDTPLLKRKYGTGALTKQGIIIRKPGHPNACKTGRIPKHVYVMSNYLGRPLTKFEKVRHKNGIKTDNRIKNLEIYQKAIS